MLDTVREIETPEGVSLRLRAAGSFGRAQAWMIDLLLRAAFFFIGAAIFEIGRASCRERV